MEVGMTSKTLAAMRLLLLAALPGALSAGAFDKGGVLGVGARPTGMGSAFTAIADDSTDAFWNPAGLVQVPRMELSTFFGPLLNGKEFYMSGAFAMPFMEQTALGVTLVSLYVPDTQSYSNQYVFTFATPLNVEKTVSFGINLKALQFTSPAKATVSTGSGTTTLEGQASGLGVDLGFLYQVPLPAYGKKVSFGLFTQDLDTQLHWQYGAVDTIPLYIAAGSAFWFEENLVADIDYAFFNDTNISGQPLNSTLYTANNVSGTAVTTLQAEQYRPHVGLEGWFFDGHLGLRTGYTGFATTSDAFTGGVSYKASNFRVDYAYMGHAEHLGDSHRLSAELDFGPGGDRPRIVSLVNPPANVAAYPSNNSVHLKWDASPDPHVLGYTIYLSKAPGTGYVPVQRRITENKVIIDGLTNGTRYYFVVTSVNNSWPAVESAYSNEVSAVPSPQLPGAPDLSGSKPVSNEPEHNATILAKGWSVATGNVKGYKLYMSSTSGSGYKLVNSDALITTKDYLVKNLEANRRYFFVLTSVTDDNPPVESTPSQEFNMMSEVQTEAPK
jgi:hypothetical protein